MKKNIALAAGLVALGALALWSSEAEELVLMNRIGTQNALAPLGEFSGVNVINDFGARVMSMGWWNQTTSATTLGDGVFVVADFRGNPRVLASVFPGGEGTVSVADAGGNVVAGMNGADGLWSTKGDVAEQFPANGSELKPARLWFSIQRIQAYSLFRAMPMTGKLSVWFRGPAITNPRSPLVNGTSQLTSP